MKIIILDVFTIDHLFADTLKDSDLRWTQMAYPMVRRHRIPTPCKIRIHCTAITTTVDANEKLRPAF